MITVKEAAMTALTFARDILADPRVNSLLLEEIELSEDQKEWLATISVPARHATLGALASMAVGAGPLAECRDYKLIRVDANSGIASSITIRKL